MKKTNFKISIAEIHDVPTQDEGHPFLTMARFILADDKPNINGQAIREDEFDSIIKSAVGMPVKMNFTGFGVADHAGSIPIGHISSITKALAEDGVTNTLVAEALLWKEEFPEEVAFLKKAFANKEEEEVPGISYEMGYTDSETVDGVQWLKKVITLAATFVKHPAYGTRTHLLALASLDEPERNEQIVALAEAIKLNKEEPVIITDKGGNLMEEELERATALAASKQAEIDDLAAQLAAATTNVATLQSEIDSMKAASLIDSRTRQYADAGFALEADAEKADKKKSLFASFDEDQWTEYLSDLVAAKASAAPAPAPITDPAVLAIAEASARNAIPRLEMNEDNISLKEAMRHLARPYSE